MLLPGIFNDETLFKKILTSTGSISYEVSKPLCKWTEYVYSRQSIFGKKDFVDDMRSGFDKQEGQESYNVLKSFLAKWDIDSWITVTETRRILENRENMKKVAAQKNAIGGKASTG